MAKLKIGDTVERIDRDGFGIKVGERAVVIGFDTIGYSTSWPLLQKDGETILRRSGESPENCNHADNFKVVEPSLYTRFLAWLRKVAP